MSGSSKGQGYVAVQAVLILSVLLAPLLDTASWPIAVVVLGGLLCLAGLAFAALGSITLGRNLSPFPKPKDDASLVQGGVFSVVRHPIYTGLSLLTLGWSMAWGSLAALLTALILLVFLDVKARREERWLDAKFAEYAAYKKRVRKLIPFLY